MEHCLSDSEILQSMLENTEAQIAYLDHDFNFVKVNSAYAKGSGRTVQELIGRNHFDLFPSEENKRIFENARDTGEIVRFRDRPFVYADHPERGVTYWDWTLTPLKDDAGYVRGLALSLADRTERKKAEDALKEAEERFRLAASVPSIVMAEVDAQLRYVWIHNPPDFDAAQVIGKRDDELDPSEDAKLLVEWKRMVLATGLPRRCEWSIRRPDGIHYYDLHLRPRLDGNGRTVGITSVAIDITERRRAAEALRESEGRANALIKYAPTGIWEIDYRAPKLISVNDAMCELSGYTREEFLSMNPTDILVGDSKKLFAERIKRQLAGEKIDDTVDFAVRKKDGSVINVTLNVSFSRENPYTALVIGHDITGRKKAEEALKESEEKYRNLFENMAQAFALCEVIPDDAGQPYDFRYLEANPAQLKMLNLPREALVGKTARELVAIRDYDLLNTYFRVALTGEPVQLERIGRTSKRWISVSITSNRKGYFSLLTQDITERKRIEEELARHREHLEELVAERTASLKESEEKFHNIIETANEGIWVTDPESNATFINQKMADMLGYTREELLGRDIIDLLVENEREAALANRPKLKQGIKLTVERTYYRKDGRTVTTLANITPLFDDKGNHIGNLRMHTDITDRKKADEALKESEAKYRRIIETANEGIWMTDTQGKAVFVNQKMADMLGYTREEIIGKDITDFMIEGDRATVLANRPRMAGGMTVRDESNFRRRDGTIIATMVNATPLFDANGRFTGLMSMHTDITERKKAEAELKASEEKYRRIIETANEGIWVSNREGKALFVNRKMADMLGYTPKELLGHDVREFVVKGESEGVDATRQRLRQGVKTQNERKFRRKDGSIMVSLVNATPRFDEQGNYDGNFTMHTDITERKRAEAELKKFPLRLFEAQEKERVNISRELHDQTGQYLTALKLLLGRIKNVADERATPLVLEAYNLTAETIQQVRDLSLSLRPPMLDSLGLAASLVWQFDRIKIQTGVSVNFEHAGLEEKLPPEISTAAFRIIQEALTNAVRHAGVKEVNVTVEKGRDALSLTVSDRGHGFDPKEIDALKSSGLANMRERTALLGGKFSISSAPGAGTTVTVELPLSPLPTGK